MLAEWLAVEAIGPDKRRPERIQRQDLVTADLYDGGSLLDECSLSNYTLSLGDVLMRYALSEEASAPGLQRGRAAHVGTPPQIANRAEEAYGTRGDLAGLGRRSE
jgi:hypothetical protein